MVDSVAQYLHRHSQHLRCGIRDGKFGAALMCGVMNFRCRRIPVSVQTTLSVRFLPLAHELAVILKKAGVNRVDFWVRVRA